MKTKFYWVALLASAAMIAQAKAGGHNGGGGGEGFAFDTRSTPYRVMQVPFIGMSLDDAFFVADSFTRLLERMVEIGGPLF